MDVVPAIEIGNLELSPIPPVSVPLPEPVLPSSLIQHKRRKSKKKGQGVNSDNSSHTVKGNEYTMAEMQAILVEYQGISQNRPAHVSKGKVYDEALRRLHQKHLCVNRINAESVRKQVQRTRREYTVTFQSIQALAHSQSTEEITPESQNRFKQQVDNIKADVMRFPELFDLCSVIWPNITANPVKKSAPVESQSFSEGMSALLSATTEPESKEDDSDIDGDASDTDVGSLDSSAVASSGKKRKKTSLQEGKEVDSSKQAEDPVTPTQQIIEHAASASMGSSGAESLVFVAKQVISPESTPQVKRRGRPRKNPISSSSSNSLRIFSI